MSDLALIDEDERWMELERRELFRTSDPAAIKSEALRVAKEWAPLIEEQHLYATIGRGKHVLVEGWTLLAAMAGCSPVVQWVKPNATGDGYIARVEVFDREGRLVGAAEAMCEHSEGHWKTRDNHALLSMAQTRATSKALRNKLGFVITLAGYEATPAEEMPVVDIPRPRPADDKPTKEHRRLFVDLLRHLESLDPEIDWPKWCLEQTGGLKWEQLDKIGAERLLEEMQRQANELSPPTESSGSE